MKFFKECILLFIFWKSVLSQPPPPSGGGGGGGSSGGLICNSDEFIENL
jgi:hypothetical protein